MNFRNRKLIIVIRTLLGLFFIMSGVTGWMALGDGMKYVPPPMVPTQMQLAAMGIFQMIKTTEIIAGLMFVTGFLPALAAIFVAPICVGVLVYNGIVAPQFLGSGVFVTVCTAYLGFAYWDKYKALFQRP